MLKRLLLVVPVALALAACGSSGNSNSPPATPSPTTAPAAPPQAAPPAAAATAAAAASASRAASAGSSPAAAASTGMSAAAHAAMVKAGQDFVDNGQWVEGKNYFTIEPQQPKVTNTDKIEVVEVFSFGCPSCNAAHQIIDSLKAQLPPYATMAFLSAGFRPDENWTLYQRAFYASKALGIADKTYDAMFDATWKTGETGSYNLATGTLKPQSKWATMQDVAKFYSKFGVSAQQFIAVANSFAVNTQMKRADELIKDYKVGGTPTLVVNGHYRFDFNSAGGYAKGIELAKWLVAKEAKQLTAASATAP